MLEGLLYRSADELAAIGRESRVIGKADRTRLFAWRALIPRRSREIVARLVDQAGARAIFEDEPAVARRAGHGPARRPQKGTLRLVPEPESVELTADLAELLFDLAAPPVRCAAQVPRFIS
jgi:hypothetical protein